jgi:hypothetical protein
VVKKRLCGALDDHAISRPHEHGEKVPSELHTCTPLVGPAQAHAIDSPGTQLEGDEHPAAKTTAATKTAA